MRMAVYVLFSALLLTVTSSGSAFDIDSEIEELKAMYGEHGKTFVKRCKKRFHIGFQVCRLSLIHVVNFFFGKKFIAN